MDRLGIAFSQMAARIREQIGLLTQKDALRRKMVAQVSHDLRTPLSSMLGYLETVEIKGETLSLEQRKEYLQIAQRQGRRLSRLVNELFELASLDAKEKKPQLEPFAPLELIHDVVQKHQLRASKSGIELKLTNMRDGLPFACGDIGLTERVLDNLLDNAIDHTPRGGTIKIAPGTIDREFNVAISDSGAGIEPDDLPHLFEPFYRGGAGDPDQDHAGLGLAIAKRIMELQSGDISVTSRSGHGATFTLRLPLA